MKTQAPFFVRLATANDYKDVAQIISIVQPDKPITADELHRNDERRDPMCHFARWVAVTHDKLIGYAHYTQYVDMYQPGKFWLNMGVSTKWQRQGIGTALYQTLLSNLQRLEFVSLQAQVGEDGIAGRRFLEKQGFVEYGRRWESYLDVANFDERPYADFATRLASQAISLHAYSDLVDDPQRDEKLHELQWLLDQDVPSLDPIIRMSLAQFRQQVVHNATFSPEGTFVALHGGSYVGMSSFFTNQADNSLVIDITGTHPDYRRRGIALALKVRGILYAKQHNYSRIIVQNDAANQGMLAINQRLGFARRPALLQYLLTMPNSFAGE